jgi:hypothetical protein
VSDAVQSIEAGNGFGNTFGGSAHGLKNGLRC